MSDDNWRDGAVLAEALNRDIRWLHRKLRSLLGAKALSADQLRDRISEVLEIAKRRHKRTVSREPQI